MAGGEVGGGSHGDGDASVKQAGAPELRGAVWTAAPWTLPATLAVAVNGALDYAVVGHPALPYRLLVTRSSSSIFQNTSSAPSRKRSPKICTSRTSTGGLSK